jgi:peptide/nickel transport system permease protein
MKEQKIQLKEVHKSLIKIGISFFQSFLLLFIGLTVSFFIYYVILRTYSVPRVIIVLDPDEYASFLNEIGYNDPISVQFQRYFINFFTGNWGESYIMIGGMPVTHMMRSIIPNTIEIMLLPTILGLGAIKLGRIWVRKKSKIYGKLLTIFISIGVAMPVIFLGPIMQYIFGVSLPKITFGRLDLPVMLRRSPSLPAPPDITGFELFDSIISREWALVNDYILHSILPWFILSLVIIPLFLKQARTEIESDSRKDSIASNSFITGKLFGFIFLITIIIELTFNLHGFGFYLWESIFFGDPFVTNGFLYMIIIYFSFTVLSANIVSIVTKFLKKKIFKNQLQSKSENVEILKEKKRGTNSSFKSKLKDYIKSTLKNPYTVIGLCLILILVIMSVVHPILINYPLNRVILPYIDPGAIPFAPPSSEHPLGTTKYGYDLLARLLYGTQEAFIFGIIVVLIGLAGGSIFGFLAGRFHRYVYSGIIGPMIIFFLFPGVLLMMLIAIFFGFNYLTIMLLVGILLIPIFTRIIANAIRRENNYFNITKAIIKYIPLEMAFAILLYQTLGFVGFGDPQLPQLGVTLNWSMASLSYWALIWPGIFLLLISLGLILLHEGLQSPTSSRTISDEQTNRRSQKITLKQ